MKNTVQTAEAPKALGPYAQAIVANGMVYCAGQIPLDPGLVSAGDTGVPFVLSHPDAPASLELFRIADALAIRERSLVGRPLGLQPV